MQISPFRGWRPAPAFADRIPSPPYDVLSTEEARRLASGDPDTFLHVVRPEIDLDPNTDPYDSGVYRRGRENLAAMIRDGRLVQDPRPAYYVYRMETAGHAQHGIVALASVEDYFEGRIKRHELTRPDKEDDRVRHIETLEAHTGPVLQAYRDVDAIDSAVSAIVAEPPAVDFTAADGVRHTLWVADDPDGVRGLERLLSALPATYVADGHHRAAAAARASRAIRERSGKRSDGYDVFLTVLFPGGQMRVLEYNRLVRDLGGLTPEAFLDRVRQAGFGVAGIDGPERPESARRFTMALAGHGWFRLEVDPRSVPGEDPLRGLDVSILTERLLQPVLGIGDPRTDPRLEFVGGIRGPEEIERRVADGDHRVGFVLFPTRLEDVMRVADAGGVMPPKTTWFEPKARSGLVVHVCD